VGSRQGGGGRGGVLCDLEGIALERDKLSTTEFRKDLRFDVFKLFGCYDF